MEERRTIKVSFTKEAKPAALELMSARKLQELARYIGENPDYGEIINGSSVYYMDFEEPACRIWYIHGPFGPDRLLITNVEEITNVGEKSAPGNLDPEKILQIIERITNIILAIVKFFY